MLSNSIKTALVTLSVALIISASGFAAPQSNLPTDPATASNSQDASADSQVGINFIPDPDPVEEILNLERYNVFFNLPKAKLSLRVIAGPFPELSYGPFKIDPKSYDEIPNDLDARLAAARDVFDKATQGAGAKEGPDPNAILRIHYADLLAMKAAKTELADDLRAATTAYATAYANVPAEFLPTLSVNFTRVLIWQEDYITALPIIKGVMMSSNDRKSDFSKAYNETLIELYFQSGRYKKAWQLMVDKIDSHEIQDETASTRRRVADVMFFLGRYQEASEWYQGILAPGELGDAATNMSWVYLAESLYRLGSRDVANKIFRAMISGFQNSGVASAIAFRLAETDADVDIALGNANGKVARQWIQVMRLARRYKQRPDGYTPIGIQVLRDQWQLVPELDAIAQLIKADALDRQGDRESAILIYRTLDVRDPDPFVSKFLGNAIANNLFKIADNSTSAIEAYHFLHIMYQYDFYWKSSSPQKIYDALNKNLSLVGLSDVSAELTLGIIERSIAKGKDQSQIFLKLAEKLLKAHAVRGALRALAEVDPKLIDFNDLSKFHKIQVLAMIEANEKSDALAELDSWALSGAAPRDLYWIGLHRAEILSEQGRNQAALDAVDSLVGGSDVDRLPADFNNLVNPLLARLVMLQNNAGKYSAALSTFQKNRERILSTDLAGNALLATISSALALGQDSTVHALLADSKTKFDKDEYASLESWVKGELWIDEVNRLLDKKNSASAEIGNGE